MSKWSFAFGLSVSAPRRKRVSASSALIEVLEPKRLLSTVSVGEPGSGIPSSVTSPFLEAFSHQLNWGQQNSAYLGSPTNQVHRWDGGVIQDFAGGRYGPGAIMMADGASTAYAVWGAHWDLYKQPHLPTTTLDGPTLLGYPISNHMNPTRSEADSLVWFNHGGAPSDLTTATVIYLQDGYITYRAGRNETAWWTKTVSAPPTSPDPLTLTVVSSSQINLSWTNSSREDGYRIFEWWDGNWHQIATVGRDVTNFSAKNLSSNAGYFFLVGAFNTDGISYSAYKSAQTITVGQPGPGISSSVTSAFKAAYTRPLGWGQPNSVYLGTPTNEVHRWDGGVIQDFTGGRYGNGAIMMADGSSTAYAIWGDQWKLYAKPQLPASTLDGPTLLGYPKSDMQNPSAAVAKNLVWYNNSHTPPSDLTTATVIYLQKGYITFRAGRNETAWWTKSIPDAPTSPNPLKLTVVSRSQINLAWQNSQREDGYYIYHWENATWVRIATVGRDVTTYSLKNLPANTGYFLKVVAFNVAGIAESAYQFAQTTTVGQLDPGIPSSVTATFQAAFNRKLGWGQLNSIYLGYPINQVHRWDGGVIQDFRGGRYGDGAIMLADGSSTAYAIWGDQWNLYAQHPVPGSTLDGPTLLGYPISDHKNPTRTEANQLVWNHNGSAPSDLTTATVIYLQNGFITYRAGRNETAWWTQTTFTGQVNADNITHNVSLRSLHYPGLPINPSTVTWIVIHGKNGSPNDRKITELASTIANTTGDQVLVIDWHEAAAGSTISRIGEDFIKPVAGWAFHILAGLGFKGSQLNVVGYSWGAYVADEFAQYFGRVNSIVALDPAEDIPGGFNPYAPGEIDFAMHSRISWAFHADDNFGSLTIPTSAQESFVVLNSNHDNIVDLFTNLISGSSPIGNNFLLSRLLNRQLSTLWRPDEYNYKGNLARGSYYEAVINASTDGMHANSLRFYNGIKEKTIP